jgi:DNA-binding NarL/FixJ family response regulator
MDIEMPVMGGVEATRRAVARNPCIKILVLTMLNRKENYSDMINAGAMGFVLKTSGKKELECAIKAVLDGESYFSSELLRQIILNNGREPQVNTFATSAETELTERELEVLGYLCQGYSVNEIAEQLFRSIKTIEAHRSKLLEKTATKNTINLVLFAIKHKIVSI